MPAYNMVTLLTVAIHDRQPLGERVADSVLYVRMP